MEADPMTKSRFTEQQIAFVYFDYLSSSDLFDDAASRVSRVTHNSVTVAGYDYLGMSQVTGVHHPEPGVFRRHESGGGGSLGVYPDLDQFGRLTASRWTRDLTTDIDFVSNTLSYDRNSNITWSEDEVYSGRDVKYTMDGLNRLIDAEEGTRSSGSITSRTRREEWSLQQVGNWDLFKLDLNGDGDQGDAGELADKGTFKTSGGTGFNELRFRDTNNDSSNDVTRVYDKNGNLTDDGVAYAFEYDAFNRLRKIKNRSNSALVEEYTYNGLGHRVGWHYDVDADGTVDGDDPWYFFAYDESWRMLATFRADDTEPKEFFINHQAGLGGTGLALGLDATILRDKDANSGWAAAYDVREERIYYCQDLRNGRADVLCLLYDDGSRAESVRYSPYGVPFGIHYADLDGDGTKTAADQAILTAAMSTSVGDPGYTVVADLNLDGEVDSADQTLYTNAAGVTLGRGALSRVKVANRKGYAGYEHDGVLHMLAHVRHRVYEIERGRWVQRTAGLSAGHTQSAVQSQCGRAGGHLVEQDQYKSVPHQAVHSPASVLQGSPDAVLVGPPDSFHPFMPLPFPQGPTPGQSCVWAYSQQTDRWCGGACRNPLGPPGLIHGTYSCDRNTCCICIFNYAPGTCDPQDCPLRAYDCSFIAIAECLEEHEIEELAQCSLVGTLSKACRDCRARQRQLSCLNAALLGGACESTADVDRIIDEIVRVQRNMWSHESCGGCVYVIP